ncbi:MAG: TetR/AcrR family transcriptional regulator [Myxococcota bacterium]
MTSNTPEAAPTPTRDRILDVAEGLFALQGFEGTSLRQITRLAGMSQPNVYNHFADKDELYRQVFDRALEPLLSEIEAATREAAPPERVIERAMEVLGRSPNLARLLHREASSDANRLGRAADRWVRDLLRAAQSGLSQTHGFGWSEHEYPLVLTAWFNIVLGYFATEKLFSDIYADDRLSPETLARQTRFLKKAWSRLMEPLG